MKISIKVDVEVDVKNSNANPEGLTRRIIANTLPEQKALKERMRYLAESFVSERPYAIPGDLEPSQR